MKMNKILFGGCSLTWGDELNSFSREKQRYSHIVSKYFNAEEINVSANALSIPQTIYKLYDAIKEDSNIDFCVVQITYTNRLVLPLFHRLIPISVGHSYIEKITKPYINNHHNEKNIAMLIAKLITSTNDYKCSSNFWEIHCAHLNMFEDICKLRNIKTLYFCTENKQIQSILRRCPNLDILDIGMLDYVFDNNLPFGRDHLLAGAHKAFAENILIPEIEKRL
jgi:hypothetical protein